MHDGISDHSASWKQGNGKGIVREGQGKDKGRTREGQGKDKNVRKR
jgi:hypothetical protein